MFKTSYNEEFRWPKATGWGIKKWPKDRNLVVEDVKRSDPIFRNNETLAPLSEECLTPFSYLLKPKPIVQTNPHAPFFKPELPKDDGSAILTRPRVYKCPEISLDDINDPEIRGKIIDFTYSTTWGIASKDAGSKVLKREVLNTVLEPPDHVLFNKKVETETKECGEASDEKMNEWEKQQTKVTGDSTSAFWQQFRHETPLKISDKTVTDEKSPEFTKKVLNLAEEKKLRMSYSLKPFDYAGHMPEFPMKIEPEKKQLEFSDPMITTYQIANRWTEQ